MLMLMLKLCLHVLFLLVSGLNTSNAMLKHWSKACCICWQDVGVRAAEESIGCSDG